uniref:Uncharacterized protein n=1 Tax=Anguilla anguilla TaxID=7936 RepID=A0A0E9TQW6_ANGAN
MSPSRLPLRPLLCRNT